MRPPLPRPALSGEQLRLIRVALHGDPRDPDAVPIDELRQRLKQARLRIEALEADREAQAARIAALETRVATLEARIL